MKNLKIRLAVASIFFAGALMAQPQGGGKGKGKLTAQEKAVRQTEKMSELLELDEKKKAELLEINQRFQTEADAIQKRHKEEMKREMKEVKTARQAALQETLNEGELKKLKEFEAQRKMERKGEGRGPGPKGIGK